MELRQYAAIIFRWLWLIILATGLAAAASFLATQGQPKIYQAITTLMVGQSIQTVNSSSYDIYTSEQIAQTYIQIAKLSQVLQGAIDALGLNASPDQLRGSISANVIQGTQLIELRVIDTDPVRAAALANEFAHQMTLMGPAGKASEQAQRNTFIQSQISDLQKKIEEGEKAVVELQSSVQVVTSAREIADKQSQISTLQGQINSWRQIFAELVASVGVGSPSDLTILEPARVPTAPIGPNVSQTVLVAALMGLALAVAGAILIEYIDDTFKTPDDIAALKLPLLGVIGRIEGATLAEKLVVARHPRSMHAEAFRIARANIQMVDVDRPIKTIVVTSANPNEGKSTITANLAVSMAQAGLRTVLVDVDMRRPVQHQHFGLTRDYGLTDGLRQSVFSMEGVVQLPGIENLRVIAAGPLPPNPAELLGSKRMRSFIEYLKQDADMIILDSPPAMGLADPVVLSQLADGVILVLDAGHTRRDAGERAKQIFERVGTRVLGVILNRISASRDSYHYYYYFTHYYQDTRRAGVRGWLRRWSRRPKDSAPEQLHGE